MQSVLMLLLIYQLPNLFQCERKRLRNSADCKYLSSHLCPLISSVSVWQACPQLRLGSVVPSGLSYEVTLDLQQTTCRNQCTACRDMHNNLSQHCLSQHKSVTCSIALHVTLHSGADFSQI